MLSEELKRVERRQRRPHGLTGGIMLVVLGIVFLLQQIGTFSLRNWWALFILIPAIGSFASTFALYQRQGFTQLVRGNLFGAIMTFTVAGMFLFELSWATYWPLFVILVGLSFFAAGLPFGQLSRNQPYVADLFTGPWLLFGGLAAVLLGVGFQLNNLGIFNPALAYGARWWSLAILLLAAGGFIATIQVLARERRFGLPVIANLAGALVVAGVGVVALFNLDWNLLWPITLIAAGAVILLGVLSTREA